MSRYRKFNGEVFREIDHNLSKREATSLKRERKAKGQRCRIWQSAHGGYDVFVGTGRAF